jgi:hypothetical protein
MIRTKIGNFKLLLQLLLTLARAHNVCTLSMYSQMENFAVIITVSNVAIILKQLCLLLKEGQYYFQWNYVEVGCSVICTSIRSGIFPLRSQGSVLDK